MEIYIKIFEVIFPVFFVIGVGYYIGKKNPKFDTNFITIFAGNIDFLGDRDMCRFSLEADTTYRFDVRGSHSNHGTLWDPQAFLYDEDNNLVAQDDDSGTGFEASISYTTPDTGDYYLNVMANIGELSQTSGSYSVESIFF